MRPVLLGGVASVPPWQARRTSARPRAPRALGRTSFEESARRGRRRHAGVVHFHVIERLVRAWTRAVRGDRAATAAVDMEVITRRRLQGDVVAVRDGAVEI